MRLAIFTLIALLPFLIHGQTLGEVDSQINVLKERQGLLQDELSAMKTRIDSLYRIRGTLIAKRSIGNQYVCKQGTSLYENANMLQPGQTLAKINRNDTVIVIEVLTDHYKVVYNGMAGYVLKLGFSSLRELAAEKVHKDSLKAVIAASNREYFDSLYSSNERRKNELVSKYGYTNGINIYEGKIWLGMTDEMVRDCWRPAEEINRTVGSWGVHEQWVYSGGIYLYFENGILTGWQD